jgi:prolyl 4-hydroxylase
VEEGGETAFPETNDTFWLDASFISDTAAVSECARGKVHVRPRRGDALLFYSMAPGSEKLPVDESESAEVDPYSLHEGCPPTKGLKWTSTTWIHTKPFRPESFSTKFNPPMVDPAVCDNFHAKCEAWAGAMFFAHVATRGLCRALRVPGCHFWA